MFIREILEVYLSSTPRDMDKLENNVEEENWEMVRYFAHKLKSSSFTIGFDSGFKVFQKIENTIKDNEDTRAIPILLKEAQDLCNQAQIQVKIELSNYV